MSVRRPVVAGAFYPANPIRLQQSIEECFNHSLGPGKLPEARSEERKIVSVVAPHAGYMYSGHIAAHAYHQLASEPKPEKIIIICPNHTGMGGIISLSQSEYWETPLGRVPVDMKLSREIMEGLRLVDMNDMAHMREHSIEVHLPFLQHIYRDFSFVPICMGYQDLVTSRKLGETLAEVLGESRGVIIASTDLTHQESQASAKSKDDGVIDRILAMDEDGLQSWVQSRRVTMCGYGAVSAAIVASKQLGATSAELLAYGTSGDAIGDYSSVVGYTAVKLSR